MDKKKTGCLIKEARMKKNYTQNELGDLLGVTNKAVSRWENGDSFPDVGLLENLSEILDIRIQDIVTGEKTANDNSAVRDVVRLAKMQQMDKKRSMINKGVIALELLCCLIAGFFSLGNKGISLSRKALFVYSVLMIAAYMLNMFGLSLHKNEKQDEHFLKACRLISVISLIFAVLVMWGIMGVMITIGFSRFGKVAMMMGPMLNSVLVTILLINFFIIIINYVKYQKNDILTTLAAIFLSVFYGDIIHRMNGVEGILKALTLSTIVALGAFAIFSFIKRVCKINEI